MYSIEREKIQCRDFKSGNSSVWYKKIEKVFIFARLKDVSILLDLSLVIVQQDASFGELYKAGKLLHQVFFYIFKRLLVPFSWCRSTQYVSYVAFSIYHMNVSPHTPTNNFAAINSEHVLGVHTPKYYLHELSCRYGCALPHVLAYVTGK